MICIPQLLIVQEGFHKGQKTVISPCIWGYFQNHVLFIFVFLPLVKKNHSVLSEQLILLFFMGLLTCWICFTFVFGYDGIGRSPESPALLPVHACPSLKSWKPDKLLPSFLFVTHRRAFLLQSTWFVSWGSQLWRFDVWLTVSSFMAPVIFHPPAGADLTPQFLAINLSQKLTM